MKKICLLFYYLFFFQCFLYSQNIGIGTLTPTRAKLEVHGAVDATTAIFGGESSGVSIQRNWPGIGFNTYWNNGNRYLINGFAAKQYLDPSSGNMYVDMFSNGAAGGLPPITARALTLSSIGNVGIKGAGTNAELQLPNTISNRKLVFWESANNDHQYFGLGIEPGTMRYSVAGTDNVHRFYAGTSGGSSQLLMSIWGNKNLIIGTQNGGSKVGINSISPLYPLEIVQTGGRGLAIIDPNTYNYFGLNTNLFGSTNNLYILYNDAGVAFIKSDGSYHSGSDERLKENITPMPETLSKLLQLRPKSYTMKYNNPDKKSSLGLIGQELNNYFPEFVSITDGASFGHKEIEELYAVNYSGLSVISIKAIQEQQQQIIDLQKRMQLLEDQNKMLIQLLKNKK